MPQSIWGKFDQMRGKVKLHTLMLGKALFCLLCITLVFCTQQQLPCVNISVKHVLHAQLALFSFWNGMNGNIFFCGVNTCSSFHHTQNPSEILGSALYCKNLACSYLPRHPFTQYSSLSHWCQLYPMGVMGLAQTTPTHWIKLTTHAFYCHEEEYRASSLIFPVSKVPLQFILLMPFNCCWLQYFVFFRMLQLFCSPLPQFMVYKE